MENTHEENDVRFTQDFIDALDIDAVIHIVGDPAFTDSTGHVRVVDRKVVTPEGYMPESNDEEMIEAEVAHIVKYELSTNIKNDVAYLQKYRYTISPDTNELKVIVHGIY